MSGSRLGRGRVGRLALLGCGILSVVFILFQYRSMSAESARLRDLHIKCAQQQEALAAQLQVIYEYKVQLEKTLSNEKSANAAVKEELQQKASRERSLRDKDSLEAMQRYNALQQNYKLLQTEHKDFQDDCKKKEDVAMDNSKKLEATLLELRIQLKKAVEAKETALESLKTKYMEIVQEKTELEERYNSLKKTTGDNNGDVERLQKQVIQLQNELDEAKKSPHFSVGGVKPESSQVLPRHVNAEANLNNNKVENNKLPGGENNQMQVIRPSSQQQAGVSLSKSGKMAAAAAPVIQSPPESSSKTSSPNKSPSKVKLPLGVPPIPRLIEPKEEDLEKKRQQESAGQAPPVKLESAGVDVEPKQAKAEETANNDEDSPQMNAQQNGNARHVGEQMLDRHEADGWFKLKHGVQEVGDPHHIEKNGFENAGGNEDVEQYDDYNYKEPQNKNGDLHIEEGEDEREDEDDYMHNNMNAVKHE